MVGPVPILESAARFASKPPDRGARLEARGGGQPTTVVSPNTTFEVEDAEFTIEESRIVGRERVLAVDPSAPRSTGERPSQPRLAEPFPEAESPASVSRPDVLPETRLATAGLTMTAHRFDTELERPGSPPNLDTSPFMKTQPGRQPSPAEAMTGSEGSRPPEVLSFLQKDWGLMLGRQLYWMINHRMQEVRINVDPPHLGPLEVRVSLHQHQTSVMFIAHEAVVREALESAMPRLRELLDGQGLQLHQVQVSDQSLARQQSGLGEQAPRQREGGSAAETRNRETVTDGTDEPPPPTRRPRGMVDDYA